MAEKKKKRINVRTKGHTLERFIANMFKKELGFEFAKTSRYASKLLDDSNVDISGIPFLIQTKSGYDNVRPKPDVIFQEIEDDLLKNFPKTDPIHTYPKVLIHKINGHKRYKNLVTMPYNDWKSLLLKIKD